MPRVSLNQTNFTAGEISPRLYGRTEIDRYPNAAKDLTNAYPVVHGGAVRRPGTRFYKAAKIPAKKARLVPFIVSRDVAYMLEFGEGYLRVHGAGGTDLGVELTGPYTEAQLPDIDWAQGADTMFVAHPSVVMQRLRNFSAAFDLSAAPFTTQPYDEQGHTLAANLTLSASTVGAGRTVGASAPVFLPTDVGRVLICAQGQATITAYSSTTSVTATISIAFAGTALASGTWRLDASPFAIVAPSAKDPVQSSIDLNGSQTRAANLTLTAKTGAITVNSSAAVFVVGDTGKVLYGDSGVAILTYVNASQCTAVTSADFASLTYATGGWGITESTWRAEDVGKYVRINNGLCQITALTSATSVKATVLTALTSIVASPPLAWTLESSVWSAANGYPRSVSLHEQRLVAGGNAKYPQTVWGSRQAEYLDFTRGTNDDDAYTHTVVSDDVNPISYLAAQRNLLLHTFGGEFSMQGGVEKPITPTNVRARQETNHGSKGVRPVKVGGESIFVQRSGRKVRALGYQASEDDYKAPDISVMAEHITVSGITEMAYQQEPDLILWAVRGDGTMLTCTLDRSQGVTAWAKHYTDGAFESVATIPNGARDEVWAIVRRTVNGAVVRYLEIFDDTFQPIYPAPVDPLAYPPVATVTTYGTTVDCGVVIDNPAGQTAFSLPHLAGKTVDIVADGSPQPQQAVALDGSLTLARSSKRTLIGLHFESRVGLLTPETGTGTGTAQGNSMRVGEATLRFLNTIGAKVFDGEGREIDVAFQQFGAGVLDQPPAPFTGLKRVEMLGWERGRSELTVVQDLPLPMHLASVVRKLTVND